MRYDRHILGGCCNLEMQGTKSRSYILQLPKKSTLKFTLFCLCSKMKWAFHSPNFVVISQVAQTVSHFSLFLSCQSYFRQISAGAPQKERKQLQQRPLWLKLELFFAQCNESSRALLHFPSVLVPNLSHTRMLTEIFFFFFRAFVDISADHLIFRLSRLLPFYREQKDVCGSRQITKRKHFYGCRRVWITPIFSSSLCEIEGKIFFCDWEEWEFFLWQKKNLETKSYLISLADLLSIQSKYLFPFYMISYDLLVHTHESSTLKQKQILLLTISKHTKPFIL